MNNIQIVTGDLLKQEVDVIVNPWNRNIIPWWLLLPHGVSGEIRKKAGMKPFVELGKRGIIPLGGAVLTCAGELPYRAIIHVAGINMLWQATESVVTSSVKNAIKLALKQNFRSIAIPLIGSGVGKLKPEKVLETIVNEAQKYQNIQILIVRYGKR